MPLPAIRLFPEPVLRKKADPVKVFDANLANLIKTLESVMRQQPHGIGIAAPQIGVSKQVALVDVSPRVPGSEMIQLINPVILELKEERASREGCMSLPDYTANIKRYDWVRFSWQDMQGKRREKISTGIEAVCVQHEIDHLDGHLFIDHVASLKRDMIPRIESRKRI